MSNPVSHWLSPAPALRREHYLLAFLVFCVEVIWTTVARKEPWVKKCRCCLGVELAGPRVVRMWRKGSVGGVTGQKPD